MVDWANEYSLPATNTKSEKSEVYMMKEYVDEVSNEKEIKAKADQLWVDAKVCWVGEGTGYLP